MAYTIYRKDKIERILMKEVLPMQSSRAVSDPMLRRDPYQVEVLVLQKGCVDATFHDFKDIIASGETVSLAINDKKDVIAVLNHSRNREGKLDSKKMSLGDLGGILFFLAFPLLIGGAIFKKAFSTHGWDSLTIGIAAVVSLIVLLVIRGISRQYTESKRALRELKAKQ